MSQPEKYDDLNTTMIGAIGLLSVILSLVVIIVFQAGYEWLQNDLSAHKLAGSRNVKADSILTDQEGKLKQYAWLDREQKTVVIPIERAMELIVKEAAAKEAGSKTASVQP